MCQIFESNLVYSQRYCCHHHALQSCCYWLQILCCLFVLPQTSASSFLANIFLGAVFNASFIPMVYFLYPETKGLSLEQIDHIFEGQGQGWSCLTQGVRESIKGAAAIEAARPEHLRLRDTENALQDSSASVGDKEVPTSVNLEHAN